MKSSPRSSSLLALFILLFWVALSSTLLQRVHGSVHRYSNARFKALQNGFLFYGGSEGMRASTTNNVNAAGVADGRSYIRFNEVKFKHSAESYSVNAENGSSNSLVQAIIFEAADRDKVGSTSAICCTSDLAESEGCKEGEVIIGSSLEDPNWPFSIPIYFEGDLPEVAIPSKNVNISKTGFYSVVFVFCNPKLSDLVIEGTTVWKNPTGYLPGSMAPLWQFYGMMSLAYIVLGLAWFLQSLRFWRSISKLQNHITVIIALSMLEATLWYFEYANFNATGSRPVSITFWAVTVGGLKKTLSRVLLLALSMGYGVVRPTLGENTSKVLLLGLTYFLAAEVLDICENVGTISDLSGKTKLLLALPVAILDAFFIIWIFVSLSKTLDKIQAKQWFTKLEVFRNLTNSLSVSVVVAVAWIGYEFYFKSTDPFGEKWQTAWIINAFWNVLSLALLCVLCILLSPSSNSSMFEFTDETAKDFDEEEAVPLNLVVVEPEKATSRPEKKEKKPISSNAFTLDTGSEDGKRE